MKWRKVKQGEQTLQHISYLGEVGSLSTCTGKARERNHKRSLCQRHPLKKYTVQPILRMTRVSPETLCETEANSRVQLKVEQLLGNVFDAVASVVELRAGRVSVHPLVVDLGRRCVDVRSG